jgi:hypothetical protein
MQPYEITTLSVCVCVSIILIFEPLFEIHENWYKYYTIESHHRLVFSEDIKGKAVPVFNSLAKSFQCR